MQLDEHRYVIQERKIINGVVEYQDVPEAFVLTPDTPYATVALMALARTWSGVDAEVAHGLRQVAADWAPDLPEFD